MDEPEQPHLLDGELPDMAPVRRMAPVLTPQRRPRATPSMRWLEPAQHNELNEFGLPIEIEVDQLPDMTGMAAKHCMYFKQKFDRPR